jgi:hypothetical protein
MVHAEIRSDVHAVQIVAKLEAIHMSEKSCRRTDAVLGRAIAYATR